MEKTHIQIGPIMTIPGGNCRNFHEDIPIEAEKFKDPQKPSKTTKNDFAKNPKKFHFSDLSVQNGSCPALHALDCGPYTLRAPMYGPVHALSTAADHCTKGQ